MRAMGLDIGSVTVGVSLSDGLKMIASSYTVIRYEVENEDLYKKIAKINIFDIICVLLIGYGLQFIQIIFQHPFITSPQKILKFTYWIF